MATVDYYSKVFDFDPPPFYERKEVSNEKFSQRELRFANMALLNDHWRIIPNEDSSTGGDRDPLDGLTRMGLVDLVNHDENEDVTLVFPSASPSDNKRLIDKTKSYGQQMRRKGGGTVWIVKNAKVKKIDKDAPHSLSGRLKLCVNDNSFMVDLPKFRECRRKRIEIWKSMPYKAKLVSDFLLNNLNDMRKDAWQKKENKRNAIVSFLLGESKNDRDMTSTIITAYFRLRTTVAEDALKRATHKLDRIEQKKASQKPAKRIRTGQENTNSTELPVDQAESDQKIDQTEL